VDATQFLSWWSKKAHAFFQVSCFFVQNTDFHFRAKKPVTMEEGGLPSVGGVVVREKSERKRKAPVASDANYVVPPAKRCLPSKPLPASRGISKKPPAKNSAQGAVFDPAAACGEAELRPLGKSKVLPQASVSELPKVLKASSQSAAGAVARQQAAAPPSSRWQDGTDLQVVGHCDNTWSTGKFSFSISFLKQAPFSGAARDDAWVSASEVLAHGSHGEGKALVLAYRLPILPLPAKDRLSKAERAGEVDHPFLSSQEMARNLNSVLASDEYYQGGPAGCRESILDLLRGVAEESKKARRKKVQYALEKDIELAAVRLVAPERIQRWWSRARVLLASRREEESLKALLSSIDRSPLLVKRRSRALSRNAPPKAPSETNVSWQIALAPPPLGDSGGRVPRPDACDSLLRLVSTEEYHLLMASFWRLLQLEGDAAEARIFELAEIDVAGSDEKVLAEKWIDFSEHRLQGRKTHLKTRAQVKSHLRKIANFQLTVVHTEFTFSLIGGL